MDEPVKRGRGRPRLSEEEKKERAEKRRTGELPTLRRAERPAFGQEYVEEGDNSRFLKHALVTMDMPPIDISDPKQVEERIWWYFNHCIDNDMKPTVMGLSNALGVHRDCLRTWKIGEYRAGTHQAIAQKAYRLLEELWEDYMMNGKIHPTSGIFLGINQFGYRDVRNVEVTPVTSNEPEILDVATIEAKYAELPED